MILLNEAFSRAKSQRDFYGILEKQGLQLYFRGKQAGVVGNRKYRLRTLGFSLERIATLDIGPNRRSRELVRIVEKRINKSKDKHNEQTF